MTKPFVFVLMPFDSSFNDVYKLGIKEAANNAGGYCERVDEQIFEERMLDRIYNQINKADVIVADLTGKNPNVFYETGYAHALDKRVILLTSNADDIPFDLKHHFHIVYNNSISDLKDRLTTRLKWYFDNPSKHILVNTSQINTYINQEILTDQSVLDVKYSINNYYNTETVYLINIRIEFCNITDTILSGMKFGFEFEKTYSAREHIGYHNVKNFEHYNSEYNKSIFISKNYVNTLLPSCWYRIDSNFCFPTTINTDNPIPVIFKLYTESGTDEIPFYIKLVEKEN